MQKTKDGNASEIESMDCYKAENNRTTKRLQCRRNLENLLGCRGDLVPHFTWSEWSISRLSHIKSNNFKSLLPLQRILHMFQITDLDIFSGTDIHILCWKISQLLLLMPLMVSFLLDLSVIVRVHHRLLFNSAVLVISHFLNILLFLLLFSSVSSICLHLS